jgi:translation initiation factor IF-3
MVPDGRRFS